MSYRFNKDTRNSKNSSSNKRSSNYSRQDNDSKKSNFNDRRRTNNKINRISSDQSNQYSFEKEPFERSRNIAMVYSLLDIVVCISSVTFNTA